MNQTMNHFDLHQHLEEQFKEALRALKYEMKLTDDVIGEFFGYKASTIRGLINGNNLHSISAGRLLSGLKALSSVGIYNLHNFVLDTSKVRIAPALDMVEPSGSLDNETKSLHALAEEIKINLQSGDVRSLKMNSDLLSVILAKVKAEEQEMRRRLYD